MSAAEIARELDLTHANASYHLRQLAAAALVQLDEERFNRGGQERRYRHDPTHNTASMDPEGRVLMLRAVAEELVRRGAYAVPHGTSADAELWVSPEVWTNVCDRVRTAMADLHTAAQPHRTPGTEHVSATVALFRMSP